MKVRHWGCAFCGHERFWHPIYTDSLIGEQWGNGPCEKPGCTECQWFALNRELVDPQLCRCKRCRLELARV